MRTRCLVICIIVLAACAALSRTVMSANDTSKASANSSIIVYTAAKQYDPLAWMRGAERFPRGATIYVKDRKQVHPLVQGFFATADPNVSFDGKSIVFAAKTTVSAQWQIFEMEFPGGEPRHIVTSQSDSVRPLYLPDNMIVYARKAGNRYILESVQLYGGKPQELSFVAGSVLPTDVLRDGRILFEAGYPLGIGSTPEIYTVYSDGSGVESYRCDHGNARYAGRQAGNGDIVFTHGKGLAKFTSPLAHEVAIDTPAGEFAGDVAETSSNEWLVSWRPNSSNVFELKKWKQGAATLESIVAEAGFNLVQPMEVVPRPLPNRHPSALHDWKAANLMVLNAYLSRSLPAAKGSIATVRVYTQDKTAKPKLLGSAPVEKDGSFYIHVPGDQPLRFELLDVDGKIVKRQRAWMWARSGEQRVCVGCHTGPERAPDNAAPQILLRSTDPVDLTGNGPKRAQTGGH